MAASSEVFELVMWKYFAFQARFVDSKKLVVEFAYTVYFCIMVLPHQLPPIKRGKLGKSKISYMAPIIWGTFRRELLDWNILVQTASYFFKFSHNFKFTMKRSCFFPL